VRVDMADLVRIGPTAAERLLQCCRHPPTLRVRGGHVVSVAAVAEAPDDRVDGSATGLGQLEIFTARQPDAEWERLGTSYAYCMARLNQGKFADTAEQVIRLLDEAHRFHDLYGRTLFGARPRKAHVPFRGPHRATESMIRRCLFCDTPFPDDQPYAGFACGRRVAWDPMRARLWAICDRCHQWTLAPFEDRLEVIDALEKDARDKGARAESRHAVYRYFFEQMDLQTARCAVVATNKSVLDGLAKRGWVETRVETRPSVAGDGTINLHNFRLPREVWQKLWANGEPS